MKRTRITLVAIMSLLSLLTGRANASPEADFWRWFQKNEATLFDFEKDQERTFDQLAAEMHKVHSSLTFEFGPKKSNQREFVISADGMRDAFPKVESLFASAPTFPRWTFTKFRPRRAPFDLEYNGVGIKASNISVLLQPDGQKVALTVLVPGYTESERRTYTGIAFLLLDQALGEYDVGTRVGRVSVKSPSPSDAKAVPLHQLPRAFDAHFPGH